MHGGALLDDATTGALSSYAFHKRCWDVICLDRNLVAEAAGFSTSIVTMPGLDSSAETDMLVGIPPLGGSVVADAAAPTAGVAVT